MPRFRVKATREGIEAVNAVDQSIFHQEIQSAIDRWRLNFAGLASNFLKDFIGFHRFVAFPYIRKHLLALRCEASAIQAANRFSLGHRVLLALIMVMMTEHFFSHLCLVMLYYNSSVAELNSKSYKTTSWDKKAFHMLPKTNTKRNKITFAQRLSFGVVLGLSATCLNITASKADDINVAASIRPIHGLVEMVLGDTGEATLMKSGATSPHGGNMRPSERRALATADLVFIIDPNFEDAYKKALPPEDRLVTLSASEGLTLLERRLDLVFEHFENHDHEENGHDDHDDHAHHDEHDEHDDHDEHAHHDEHDEHDDHDEHAHHDDHGDHDDHHGHDHGDEFYDLHLWLDPDNAIAMVKTIRDRLSARYPEHQASFIANADAAIAELRALDAELESKLAPVAGKGFMTHHDAFYYFENAYGLTSKASIYNHHDAAASIGRLRQLRHIVGEENVICMFHEPQYNNDVLHVIDPDHKLKQAELDPLSADLEAGPDFYGQLMRRLAERMSTCLQ